MAGGSCHTSKHRMEVINSNLIKQVLSANLSFTILSFVSLTGKVHTHMLNSRLKHSVAEFQSFQFFLAVIIGHRFIVKKKKGTKTKNADAQKLDTFLV